VKRGASQHTSERVAFWHRHITRVGFGHLHTEEAPVEDTVMIQEATPGQDGHGLYSEQGLFYSPHPSLLDLALGQQLL